LGKVRKNKANLGQVITGLAMLEQVRP